jgi:hypothetical protein
VNNSLCFPFIFRGALDCGATKINEEMKLAGHQGAGGAGARRAFGHRGARVRRGHAPVRSRLPDPAGIRPAPHHHDRSRGRARRDGQRCRHAADPGLQQVSRPPRALRVRVRRDDGARLLGGEGLAQARRVCRGRGRACAARSARPPSTKGSRDRCSSAARTSSRAASRSSGLRLARQGLRRRQHPRRLALSRLLERVLQARRGARASRAGRRRRTCARGPRSLRRCSCTRATRTRCCAARQQLAGAPALHPAGDRRTRRCEGPWP